MTLDELTRLREEVARLRAAIAPTAENVAELGMVLSRRFAFLLDTDLEAILAAINERAKL